MAETDIGGNYETSPHWQHAGEWYNVQSDSQLNGKGAARDDKHRVLKDAKAQVGTTHLPKPHPLPCQELQLKVPMQTHLLRPLRQRENLALSVPHMPVWTHLLAPQYLKTPCQPYTAAVPSHLPWPRRVPVYLKRITSTVKWTSPSRRLPAPQVPLLPASRTALMLYTHDYFETDADLWGGLGNVEGDTMAQPQSITSSSTAKGTVFTQELATCHVYAQVDLSKKKSRRGGDS